MSDLEQLRQHAYTPPETEQPPCANCGHAFEDHADDAEMAYAQIEERPCLWEFVSSICPCEDYHPLDAQEEAERADDAAIASWEAREGR